MSRSTSRSKRSRQRNTDEQEPLLTAERDHSTTPSYRSFPDHDSWSATSSTLTPSPFFTNRTEVQDELPANPVYPDGTDASHVQDRGPSPDTSSHHGITRTRAFFIVPALATMLFLQASNISLLTTTQGVIAEDLDAFEYTTWFTSAYLVAMSSTGPVYGKLSYIFSARWLLFTSSVIFFFSAFVIAFTPSVAGFLFGRALSGIGAAGILCTVQVLIQYVPTKRKGIAQGVLNTGFTTGVAAGAILAGAIQPALGWRAMFWIQVPFIFASGTLLLFSIPPTIIGIRPKQADHDDSVFEKLRRIDYLGAFLLVATLVALLYGFASSGFDTASIATIVIALAVLLPLFIYQEAFRHPDPIISIKILKSRPIFFACMATLGYMMSRWSVLFYTPIYATAVRGMHPAQSGTLLVPTNLGFALGGLISGQFHIRRDGSFYASCLVLFTIYPVTLLAVAFCSTATISMSFYCFLLLCNGLCAGAGMNYTLAHIQHLAHVDVRLIAISIFFTFRGFAGTFGATIGGGVFYRALSSALRKRFKERGLELSPKLLRELVGSPRTAQLLDGAWKEAAISGYVDALKALFLAGVGLSLVTLVLQALTGWTAPEDEKEEGDETAVGSPL